MKRFLAPLFLLLLALPLRAYDLPDLGDSSGAVFSDQDEQALGHRVMQEIRSDPAYFDDQDSVDFLNSVGGRLLAISDDVAGQQFEFFLLQDPTLNAFALPGGFVGVHTGLMLAAENESELASVLAHEISHVTQHHIARMMEAQKKNLPITIASMAAAILAARTSPDGAVGGMVGAQAQAIQAELNFSRENEREADRLGIQRMIKSGYDPRAMASFFSKLQRYGRFYEGAPAFLQTHPLTTERLAEIQNRLENVPYRQVQDRPDFLLIRSRIAALVGTPHEALRYFEGKDLDIRRPEDIPLLYGKAVALWRNGLLAAAEKQLAAVRAVAPPHVLFVSLDARIVHDQGHLKKASQMYETALSRYPDNRALNYGHIETLIDLHHDREALAAIDNRLQLTSSDHRLYEMAAKAYAGENRQMESHAALAEAYLALDNPSAALDQLEIALRSGDGDFYERSAVESRLEMVKKYLAPDKKKKGKSSS